MNVTPELVAETLRFCLEASRRKATELEQAAADAKSPEDALQAIASCLLSQSLLALAEDPLRMAAEGSGLLSRAVIAEALDTFGPEADQLRALLGELCDGVPSNVVPLFGVKVLPADA